MLYICQEQNGGFEIIRREITQKAKERNEN